MFSLFSCISQQFIVVVDDIKYYIYNTASYKYDGYKYRNEWINTRINQDKNGEVF